ncbi:BrnA antitoxin family protein [Oryzicola mucosus]|uniref:BrnA antitoxin family protein n=1 Tax=Oryzicola mucosus TaxID=2767425 RepID=A0A8J6PX28_9HYPH|nr:BrnA antitoxin family protein [Oryzicola mucosus]MBD0415838.1 BrnA antitoxin family protein [Oryzicola mucosus]
MTKKWPSFVTKDLGDGPEDEAEMHRRWETYNREMQAIISAGGVHRDADGWWVDDATGALIGPDPEIERPLTAQELAGAKPLKDVLPDLYESLQRARGRPKVEKPKQAVTLRLDPDTLAFFKDNGPDWRSRMAEILDHARRTRKRAGG